MAGQDLRVGLTDDRDTVDVRPYVVVDILVRFKDRGRYMLRCHNLEHEDMAMMANLQVM